MPGYDHINVVADADPDPVAAKELGERIRTHPKLLPAGSPDFGPSEPVPGLRGG